MADVGVAHYDERTPLPATGRGLRGEIQEREDRVVVDRVIAQSPVRGLRMHQRGDVVEGCHPSRLAPLASLRQSEV